MAKNKVPRCIACGGDGLLTVDLTDGTRAPVRGQKNRIVTWVDRDILAACKCPAGNRYVAQEGSPFIRFDHTRMRLSVVREGIERGHEETALKYESAVVADLCSDWSQTAVPF